MYPQPFRPLTTRNIEGTFSTAPITVNGTAAAVPAQLPGNVVYQSQSVDLLICNLGSTWIYVTYATSEDVLPAASATNGIPIAPNSQFVIDVPGIITWISVFGGSATIVRGWGLGS